MPELPEVETTRRGLAPYTEQQVVEHVTVRQPKLRWPIPDELPALIEGQRIGTLVRRAKYLLMPVAEGHLLWHLGMSGSLRLVSPETPVRKHDHVELLLSNGYALRYHDPRRFGALLWLQGDPMADQRIASLGPEPLSAALTGAYLYEQSRGRKAAVKNFIMDNAVVVGVGNIYASEALFLAGIDPRRAAGRISLPRYEALTRAIQQVLAQAIEVGGTTLRDFVGSDGAAGYFAQQLRVYGRAGEACRVCQTPLKSIRLGQRASVFCPHCQR